MELARLPMRLLDFGQPAVLPEQPIQTAVAPRVDGRGVDTPLPSEPRRWQLTSLASPLDRVLTYLEQRRGLPDGQEDAPGRRQSGAGSLEIGGRPGSGWSRCGCHTRFSSRSLSGPSGAITNGRRWSSLPSWPLRTAHGHGQRDESSGVLQIGPPIMSSSRQSPDRWSKKIVPSPCAPFVLCGSSAVFGAASVIMRLTSFPSVARRLIDECHMPVLVGRRRSNLMYLYCARPAGALSRLSARRTVSPPCIRAPSGGAPPIGGSRPVVWLRLRAG